MVDYPYISLEIGGKSMTPAQPTFLKSLEYTKVTDAAANKIEIVLYDDSAVVFESELIKGGKQIKFSYGVTPQSAVTYTADVLDYSMTFTGYGAELTISGISTGVIKSSGTKSASYSGSPSDVLKQVAYEEGWCVGNIEGTTMVFTTDSSGKSVPKTYYRNNKTATNFIKEDVLPFAKSTRSGQGGYLFYFSDQASNGSVVNFHTTSFTTTSHTSNSFVVGTRDSKVLSFTPSYSGTVMLASGVTVTGTDPSGKPISSTTGNTSRTETVALSVSSLTEAKLASDYLWQLKLREVYSAELTLINTPNIQPLSVISVTVLTKSGVPHHSSGLYVVLEVVDSINGGQFTSTLKLNSVKA